MMHNGWYWNINYDKILWQDKNGGNYTFDVQILVIKKYVQCSGAGDKERSTIGYGIFRDTDYKMSCWQDCLYNIKILPPIGRLTCN